MPKQLYRSIELFPSAARTAGANQSGAIVELDLNPPGALRGMVFTLDVTNAATDVDDTLNVFIDALVDGAWIEVVHFPEVLGNGDDALKYFEKIAAGDAEAGFETVAAAALAAGNVRNVLGHELRARYTIVDPTGSNATFTFGVSGTPM